MKKAVTFCRIRACRNAGQPVSREHLGSTPSRSRDNKNFPGVVANDNVSFQVAPGHIHALLGENGASKSTLVKMIYGVMQPDQGSLQFDGGLCAAKTGSGSFGRRAWCFNTFHSLMPFGY